MNEDSGLYEYTIGFVTTGEYIIGLTCDADMDDAINLDNEEGKDPVVVFFRYDNVVVTTDETTVFSFD